MKKVALFLLVASILFAFIGCENMNKINDLSKQKKLLQSKIGYDKLTLHGKYRSYKVDVKNGDSLTHYSLGNLNSTGSSGDTKVALPSGTIIDGIEYPTFWSRLPLSIQANNENQRNGLYSIHEKGTSLIFPENQIGKEKKDENNMRACTAGVYVAFETNSSKIEIKYRYLNRQYDSKNFNDAKKTGRAFTGFDIYKIENSIPIFKKNFRDSKVEGSFIYETNLQNNEYGKFIIMLPTYNGFEQNVCDIENKSGLTFIFSESANTYEIEPFNESNNLPILIYGTSITQGDGSNSLRPGATYAAQIMFATNREVINCGFAGSAQVEYKMADFLSQIKSECFIIDPGWNLTSNSISATECTGNGEPANISNDEIVERVKYMVKQYRTKNSSTPIIICPKYLKESDNDTNGGKSNTPPSTIKMPKSFVNENKYLYSREGFLLYKAYLELKEEEIENIFWAEQGVTIENKNYLSGSNLHPGIQGMTDIANFILATIKKANSTIYSGEKLFTPKEK